MYSRQRDPDSVILSRAPLYVVRLEQDGDNHDKKPTHSFSELLSSPSEDASPSLLASFPALLPRPFFFSFSRRSGSAAWLGAAPPPSSAPPRCQSHPRSSRGSSPLSISYPSPSSPISSCPSPWIGDRNSNFSIPQVCYFVLLFLPIILLIFPLILFFNSFILPHHFFPYFFPNILFLYHKQTGFRTCSTF